MGSHAKGGWVNLGGGGGSGSDASFGRIESIQIIRELRF